MPKIRKKKLKLRSQIEVRGVYGIGQLKLLAEDSDKRFQRVRENFEYSYNIGKYLSAGELKRIKSRINDFESARESVMAILKLQALSKIEREKHGIKELKSSKVRELKKEADKLGEEILLLTADYRQGKDPKRNLPGK